MQKERNHIPKYISSFDLEEARLGQAIQATKMILPQEVLKAVLIKIRDESVNAEYAINSISIQQQKKNDLKSVAQLQILLHRLKEKISNE